MCDKETITKTKTNHIKILFKLWEIGLNFRLSVLTLWGGEELFFKIKAIQKKNSVHINFSDLLILTEREI